MHRFLIRAVVGVSVAAAATVGLGVTASPAWAPDFSLLLGGSSDATNGRPILELKVSANTSGAKLVITTLGIGSTGGR